MFLGSCGEVASSFPFPEDAGVGHSASVGAGGGGKRVLVEQGPGFSVRPEGGEDASEHGGWLMPG